MRIEPTSTLSLDFGHALSCGDLPLADTSAERRRTQHGGCRARTWRVFVPPWCHDDRSPGGFSEFHLVCKNCAASTYVRVEWDAKAKSQQVLP